MKSILKILGVLSVLAIIGASGYFIYKAFFTAPATTTIAKPETIDQKKAELGVRSPDLNVFSKNKALSYWIDEKTGAIYYADPTGTIFKLFGAEREEEISTQSLPDFHSLTPSPDGTKALAEFGYPFEPVFAVFNTENNSWERLPQGTIAADFDPTSKQIAFVTNGTSGSLKILNLADKKSVTITAVPAGDLILSWIKSDKIYLQSKPTSASSLETWSADPVKKTLKKLDILGSALDTIMLRWFKKSGLGLRLSAPTVNTTNLSLVHVAGAELLGLPFKTLPDKCAFANADLLYCAVPNNLPARANLPDDYFQKKIFTTDSIISYNLETLEERVLFSGEVDATELNILGNQLFFINRYDEKIYSLKIN